MNPTTTTPAARSSRRSTARRGRRRRRPVRRRVRCRAWPSRRPPRSARPSPARSSRRASTGRPCRTGYTQAQYEAFWGAGYTPRGRRGARRAVEHRRHRDQGTGRPDAPRRGGGAGRAGQLRTRRRRAAVDPGTDTDRLTRRTTGRRCPRTYTPAQYEAFWGAGYTVDDVRALGAAVAAPRPPRRRRVRARCSWTGRLRPWRPAARRRAPRPDVVAPGHPAPRRTTPSDETSTDVDTLTMRTGFEVELLAPSRFRPAGARGRDRRTRPRTRSGAASTPTASRRRCRASACSATCRRRSTCSTRRVDRSRGSSTTSRSRPTWPRSPASGAPRLVPRAVRRRPAPAARRAARGPGGIARDRARARRGAVRRRCRRAARRRARGRRGRCHGRGRAAPAARAVSGRARSSRRRSSPGTGTRWIGSSHRRGTSASPSPRRPPCTCTSTRRRSAARTRSRTWSGSSGTGARCCGRRWAPTRRACGSPRCRRRSWTSSRSRGRTPTGSRLRDAARSVGLTKFADVNLTQLVSARPLRDTVEVRILPGAIEADAVVRCRRPGRGSAPTLPRPPPAPAPGAGGSAVTRRPRSTTSWWWYADDDVGHRTRTGQRRDPPDPTRTTDEPRPPTARPCRTPTVSPGGSTTWSATTFPACCGTRRS